MCPFYRQARHRAPAAHLKWRVNCRGPARRSDGETLPRSACGLISPSSQVRGAAPWIGGPLPLWSRRPQGTRAAAIPRASSLQTGSRHRRISFTLGTAFAGLLYVPSRITRHVCKRRHALHAVVDDMRTLIACSGASARAKAGSRTSSRSDKTDGVSCIACVVPATHVHELRPEARRCSRCERHVRIPPMSDRRAPLHYRQRTGVRIPVPLVDA